MFVANNYSDNRNNTRFKGLTKILNHHIRVDGKKDIVQLIEEKQPKNTYVGELPPMMFYALPKGSKRQNIKALYKVFDEASNEIREFKPSINGDAKEYKERRPQKVVDKFRDIFVKLGILKKDSPFDLKFIGAGEYKRAYKFEGLKDPKTNEEIEMSVFHVVDKSPEWHKYKAHGNFAELNIASHWKKQYGQYTQRGKFYFGDINNGYIVNKFIDKNVEPPKRIINEYDDGIKLTDEFVGDNGHNKLFGYSFDWGGPRVVNRLKNESKVAKYILKQIKNTPEQDRYLEWYNIKHLKGKMPEDQKQAGLSLAIKHMGDDKENYIRQCLGFNNPKADMGLAYALKYLPPEKAKHYFEILMKRNNPETQSVLLNEIPLLSREKIDINRADDVNVPKGDIIPERIQEYYEIAKKEALPEVQSHLASYVHLLPRDRIIPEANELIERNDYATNDRLLHKIKYLDDSDLSFSDKMTMLNEMGKSDHEDFIKGKIKSVKTQVIRNSLEEE